MGSLVVIIATVVYFALLLYFFLMWGRFILDLVRTVRRDWRPAGAVLVLAEVAYTVTDPPIRFFRRIIPPLRLGAVALDFGWSITMLLVIIGLSVAGFFRSA
ncbi:YggT family protein [Herbiconiux sp. CPCC 203407]|uniref:YggT family protein n=1 Tax=Herbiconiux oxytropis TaxID=2970915 RepID=A0AA41XKR2_9MICO|nr:YggT family protein [Herbiconiux oxytropis]MCS5722821.1 YggT family protein [Herbiconiux oxytropis]MCS5727751.1 YggT family protein [Herbiconiux oxytropis]